VYDEAVSWTAKATIACTCACACAQPSYPPQPPADTCADWHQWGNGAGHGGASCATAQPLARVIADIVVDPFIAQEESDAGGDLLTHYQVPLVDGDHVFVMEKRGIYTACAAVADPMTTNKCYQYLDGTRFDSQIWTEARYDWVDGTLAFRWAFESDWKPPHYNETMFQPVVVGDVIAIPAARGALWLVDAGTGLATRHVEPFATLLGATDNIRVAGALATDGTSIYYNAVDRTSRAAWLVVVGPDGGTRVANYHDLVPGAPLPDAQCTTRYKTDPMAKPPVTLPLLDANGHVIPAPTVACGPQVPGMNAAPALADDGTIYVATHAAFAAEYSYLVAVDKDTLAARWATSLRDRVRDGCGLWVTGCTPGAPTGVDPETGEYPALMVDDYSSSSPVALPHGGVIYGALTYYNGVRGHLASVAADGTFVGTYDFGWDLTPAVTSDGTRDLVVLKDNHYFDVAMDGGPYFITELDALTLQPVWQVKNTERLSCGRGADGIVRCVDTLKHPNGFEWCVNAPAIDATGTIYVDSEDGHLYAITPDGKVGGRIFLEKAIGAAYTPMSIDHAGRLYSLNNGHVLVIGS
jgi:outer membrane protein assembly factor BamB